MAPIDWFALILCSYLVGLTVAAEVKDIALVEMAIDNNIKELSTGPMILDHRGTEIRPKRHQHNLKHTW